MNDVVLQTQLSIGRKTQGKVRDLYDLGDRLLLVGTDRISAFDWILPCGIPDKGKILTQLSRFWFDRFDCNAQVLSYDAKDAGITDAGDLAMLAGRCVLVKKAKVFPVECVVRGYLAGSGWKEYQTSQTVCGIALPPGLSESDQLPTPLFTPATKATAGHDENITFEQAASIVGMDVAQELKRRSLDLYQRASVYARGRGLLIADTKFEFGLHGEDILLVDEALTPDSSRFWDAQAYRPGQKQEPLDKQLVRNWLEQSGWDKNSPPPMLPASIIASTRVKYVQAFERLTGKAFAS